MFQSQRINRQLKTESNKVLKTMRTTQVYQHKNYSFEYLSEYNELPKKLRCQSTYSNIYGFRSYKYQLFHDIISEFAEHKKQRLANVIIQNLRFKEKPNLPSSNSARNLFSKSGLNLNHNYSQFMKKVKDLKIAEQNIITPNSICMSLTREPSFEQVLETKQTITLSCSRQQSPKMLFKPQQFILKSKFKTNYTIEKILTEAQNQMKTSQSPRSVQVSQHKKAKSQPLKIYTEQNKRLQRVILKTKLNQ